MTLRNIYAALLLPPARHPSIIFPPLVQGGQYLAEQRGIGWLSVNWFYIRPMLDWPWIYNYDEPEKFVPWAKRVQ